MEGGGGGVVSRQGGGVRRGHLRIDNPQLCGDSCSAWQVTST